MTMLCTCLKGRHIFIKALAVVMCPFQQASSTMPWERLHLTVSWPKSPEWIGAAMCKVTGRRLRHLIQAQSSCQGHWAKICHSSPCPASSVPAGQGHSWRTFILNTCYLYFGTDILQYSHERNLQTDISTFCIVKKKKKSL